VVARPPVKLSIDPMTFDDLPAVQASRACQLHTPWPTHAYQAELETNKLARYLVVRAGREVVVPTPGSG